MKATAVIPARGGSRGVLRKNLRVVGGVPLVVRSVRAALAAESVDWVIVSTDDPEIASVARRAGAEVHDRGIHAGPDATVAQVVALVAENYSLQPEDGPVVVLQPTSPFTDGPLIDAVVAALDDGPGFDSVETVRGHFHALYRADAEPLHRQVVNRQHADVVAWVPTGAVRAMRSFPAEGGPLSGEPMVGERHGLIDPAMELHLSEREAERYALDVDTPADFAVARDLASRGRVTFAIAVGRDSGSGHLHRCLTLADELAHHHVEFDFAWSDAEWAKDMVEARGHRMAYHGPDVQPDVMVYDCLEEVQVGHVRSAQARGCRTVVLECLDPAVVAAADLAVNSLYTGPPGALCGPHWEPLRPEFAVADEGVWTQAEVDAIAGRAAELKAGASPSPHRPTRVLVTFGGTDPSHLTERFAEVAASLGYDLRVLWPPGRPELADFPEAWGGLDLWAGSVSDALAWADLAITSGGRTVLEAAAMGCPAVVVAAHEREEHHAPVPGMMWLGHHAQVTDAQVSSAVVWLARNPAERAARGERARAAVDPAGATVRLADMIDRLVRG